MDSKQQARAERRRTEQAAQAASAAATAMTWAERGAGERPWVEVHPPHAVPDPHKADADSKRAAKRKAKAQAKAKAAKRARKPKGGSREHPHLALALPVLHADTRARRKAKQRGGKAAPAPVAPVTALGWFLLAGVILAWPREGGVGARLAEVFGRPGGVGGGANSPEALDHAEPGHGRAAGSPTDIPTRGWRDIASRAWHEFNNDRIVAVAAGVTFFGLLSLFPAMGAFVSLYGLFADVHTAEKQLEQLSGVLPKEALGFVGDQMLRISQARGGTLSLTFIISLLLSLWSANGAVKAMFDGLNVAYEERETRGLVKLNLVSLVFTLGAIVFMMLAVSAVVLVPVVLGLIGWKLGPGLQAALGLLRWPLLLLGVIGALSALYRFGPSRQSPRWRWLTPGSIAAAVLWLAASMLFSLYVSHFGSYDKTYGSLGAVVGLMTWLWISVIVVLFGAELNSEIEHQTAVDTTTGAPRPMGSRGAKMADTLGAALLSR